MANQHTPGERRAFRFPVMLTASEHAEATRIAELYDATVSDVLRAGIAALAREHELGTGTPIAHTPMVHILRAGKAVCGLPGLRVDWPRGDRWVRMGESGATCPTCIQIAVG